MIEMLSPGLPALWTGLLTGPRHSTEGLQPRSGRMSHNSCFLFAFTSWPQLRLAAFGNVAASILQSHHALGIELNKM